jgi:Cys-tRNA(Pro)/Cys-tRNA(Cys) deacylase
LKNSVTKTNAARILDQEDIKYTIRTYEVVGEHQSALEVAKAINVEPNKIYKTLVLKGQKDPFLIAVIPSDANLDFKKIAKASGNKNCEMLPLKDLLATTGYIRGGCSPIGMKKLFPTYIEELASLEETIIISAGKKGVQIEINPEDLQQLIHAKFVDLIA